MYKELQKTIFGLKHGFDRIPEKRKGELEKLAGYVRSKLDESQTAKLNFICTHNSRRSHLAQIWTAAAAHHFGLKRVETYSGGTEATAFNPNAVAALERAGYKVENPGGKNPEYRVHFDENTDPLVCFSKTFDHSANPKRHFAAVMTCSDADENCPFVPGAEFRIPVTYRDPKESDGTEHEKETYDERCMKIGREMLYMISLVNAGKA
ncbi:MAG: protein-tyrosine-phosphatase [Bacteroidetes bacterium]|jgi:arsenate reductase|nr:protein-tyrosine-phosphatase [Bacteroidota bacterium]